MLRVGLTGELGSGKSTAGRMLAERGAVPERNGTVNSRNDQNDQADAAKNERTF